MTPPRRVPPRGAVARVGNRRHTAGLGPEGSGLAAGPRGTAPRARRQVDGGTNPLMFAQTFMLAPTATGSWYIHNDVFRLNYT